jgi:MFS family permease
MRRVIVAATLGWALDAFDFTLFLFALPELQKELGFDKSYSGLIVAATLICSAVGGVLFGVLADRFGRARMLAVTIVVYSFASLASASSQSGAQLMFWRCILGLGMGGEWATGATLVAESLPPERRNRALALMQSGWALGFILSALAAQSILPTFGWRWLFALGVVPAVCTLWIRHGVPESAVWIASRQQASGPVTPLKVLLGVKYRRTFLTATAMVSCVMFGVWGFFTWLPSFLGTPKSEGGAGQSIFKSTNWIIALQSGAFVGYVSFGFVADWIGRRRAYVIYVMATAVMAPIFVATAQSAHPEWLLLVGPLTGMFGHGHFSALAPMLSELFPVEIRATAQSAIYNLGRGFSAGAPYLIGILAQNFGFTVPLVLASGFFVFAAIILRFIPKPHSS